MNTEFILADRQLTLIRYPEKLQHVSLQAWDSADELLIDHVESLISDMPTCDENDLVIVNDDFGALGCWFTHVNPIWISDSYISLRSLKENLTKNGHSVSMANDTQITAPVSTVTSVESMHFEPAHTPKIVVIKVPRTLALLEQQLIDIRRYSSNDTHIVAGGKAKAITKSVLALFEKYIGPTTTSLAKKKSRLIFSAFNDNIASCTSPYPVTWTCKSTAGKVFTLHNHANVFSRQSLDIGARIMLSHMTVAANDVVVDLGCGNGILGLNALNLAPHCKVIFVDESFMALESARQNVLENFPEAIDQCQFIASNCLEQLIEQQGENCVSKVLCNPPFHQQNAITDHIAWQMFHDAKDALGKGGHLVVVGNRHLDYHIKLKRIFGGITTTASDSKFVVFTTAKR
ncbi:methyltransferase [Alteromonas sp.]|nr:methyltransferase [Alteromonas sp.]